MVVWSEIIERTRIDPSFRSWLIRDPVSACKAAGGDLPPSTELKVVVQNDLDSHFIIGVETKIKELDEILMRATTDAELKKALLEDADSVLRASCSNVCRSSGKYYVHQRSPGEVLVFLRDVEDELEDAQLESVSGGTSAPKSPANFPRENGIIAILIG